jgi:hypothetical protein
MKKYNFFYDGRAITSKQFEASVPENWQDEVDNGEYSWGYYRASEIEEE